MTRQVTHQRLQQHLEQKIIVGRDTKARRFARALWDSWTPTERRGLGVRDLRAKLEDRAFWKDLAVTIGAREPSNLTIEVVLSKLDIATKNEREK